MVILCIYDDCNSKAYWGYKYDTPLFCKTHGIEKRHFLKKVYVCAEKQDLHII